MVGELWHQSDAFKAVHYELVGVVRWLFEVWASDLNGSVFELIFLEQVAPL